MRPIEAAIARWLSVDPIAVYTMAGYLYSDNNPIGALDPSGLAPEPRKDNTWRQTIGTIKDLDNDKFDFYVEIAKEYGSGNEPSIPNEWAAVNLQRATQVWQFNYYEVYTFHQDKTKTKCEYSRTPRSLNTTRFDVIDISDIMKPPLTFPEPDKISFKQPDITDLCLGVYQAIQVTGFNGVNNKTGKPASLPEHTYTPTPANYQTMRLMLGPRMETGIKYLFYNKDNCHCCRANKYYNRFLQQGGGFYSKPFVGPVLEVLRIDELAPEPRILGIWDSTGQVES